MDVNRKAPAVGKAEALIQAPVKTVWGVLSDLERWPEWNKSVAAKRTCFGPVFYG